MCSKGYTDLKNADVKFVEEVHNLPVRTLITSVKGTTEKNAYQKIARTK